MGRRKEFMKALELGEAESKSLQYVYNVGSMLSQVGSVVLGGDPDETISSRSGKARDSGKKLFIKVVCPLIDWLFQDPTHCTRAIEKDEGKRQIWDWSK